MVGLDWCFPWEQREVVLGGTQTFYILISKCVLQCVLEENTREHVSYAKQKSESFKDLLHWAGRGWVFRNESKSELSKAGLALSVFPI